jgi:DNA-directed RNA polymerase subunit M/transcription elongation factor TFIIS
MNQINMIEREETEEAAEECYDCHEYEYIEKLDGGIADECVRLLYACIHCGHTRVLTKSLGVRE